MYGQDRTENLFQQMFMLTLYDKKNGWIDAYPINQPTNAKRERSLVNKKATV